MSLLHLLVRILLHGITFLSSPFVNQYGLVDFYSIPWITGYNTYLLLCLDVQIVPYLASLETLRAGSHVLLITSLFFGLKVVPGLMLYSFCSSSGMSHFSKEPWFNMFFCLQAESC